jgi:4a-hydroxytetrahydrobiopterin dehydratase
MRELSDEDVDRHLEKSAWRREGDEIVRDRDFGSFAAAIEFVNRVAEVAEAADHHPDILVHGWNRVRLRVTTHSAGALTEKDFELASTIDRLDE